MSRTLLIVALLAVVVCAWTVLTTAPAMASPTIAITDAGPPATMMPALREGVSGPPPDAVALETPRPVARAGPICGLSVVKYSYANGSAASGTSAPGLPKHVEATARTTALCGLTTTAQGAHNGLVIATF